MEQIITQTDFAKDVLNGLSANPKYLSSKYFYNDTGSRIFQDIMRMPEYYLTDCELEIFETQSHLIFQYFTKNSKDFDLVELGAGDGTKTKLLLSHFLNENCNFDYIPIDISKDAVRDLVISMELQLPELNIHGRVGDYFKLIDDIGSQDGRKKILLFLGSNIGNFNKSESLNFLSKLSAVMNHGDLLFIGFDLKKDPEIILNAYNDPHGHTAAFNLNLLDRINDELNANFILQNFKHRETYNPETGTAKSELISQQKQVVEIEDLSIKVPFEEGEAIFMEISQKYDEKMISELAERSGFQIVRNFYDRRLFYMNSLWKLK